MNTAIILAGGTGSRVDSDIPKQFINIKDKMIIDYSIDAFVCNPHINKIIIVCNKEWMNNIKYQHEIITIIPGGKSRTESSYNGLLECSESCTNVLIHDAARPFISQNIINHSLNYLKKFDASVPTVDCQDSLINEKKLQYINREQVKIVQTPQAFKYPLIYGAYIQANSCSSLHNSIFTDDLSLLIKYNHDVNIKLFNGEKINFKITKEEDLVKANLLA